ncbi:hypothetical protein PG996_000387 [Apiospora saccharicola]|uniref:Granulins domain-containing protein n=1 Tax=Apiospora saccharicola TaxID=335842 RepID=A0ABR1WGG2_9PEZI
MVSPQQALLGLPASLLVLIATQLHAQQVLPTAVKKMSLDEGEKLLPHHMAFAAAGPELEPARSPIEARRNLAPEEELLLSANSSATLPFRPPFGTHYNGEEAVLDQDHSSLIARALFRRRRDALARLQGRSWGCPENTKSCDTIGQPNYCCATGERCFRVTGAPAAGNVGCCPTGANCGGAVGDCGSGSTACAAEQGGGCCIPGYVCAQVGCVASSVSVITMTTTSSTVIAAPSPTTVVTTVVVTVSPSSPKPTTSTVTQTTTGKEASDTGGLPPYRPTSGSGSPVVTTDEPAPSPTTEPPSDYCPTGFYACLATAGSGCCRTGRDCVTTSCPPIAKTTLISNGLTLVVPVTDVPEAPPTPPTTSTCAGGWFLCPGDAGPVAGCCPSGYECGTASCTLSAATATVTVQKELPAAGSSWRRSGDGGARLG